MGWCGVEAAAHLWSRAEQQSRPLWSSRADHCGAAEQAGTSSSSSIAGSPAPLSHTLRGVHISDQDQDIFIFFLFCFFLSCIFQGIHIFGGSNWSRGLAVGLAASSDNFRFTFHLWAEGK